MSLSNNYIDCQILNLDATDPRHGPFVVTQDSVDSDDPQQRTNMYLLRRDGSWVEYTTYALMAESERVPVAFDSMGDITRLMQDLPSKPNIVREEHTDQAALAQFLQQVKAEGGMLAHIKGNVARYKAQKRM
jgi:hypothetical protein